MSFSFVARSANPQTSEETQLVLTYELGRVFKCLYGRHADTGYIEFGATELADCISMCRMFCEQSNWSFDSTYFETENLDGRSVEQLLGETFIALAGMIRGVHYYKRFHDCRGPSPKECMDKLVCSIRRLCNKLHLDFGDLVALGESRYMERMHDLQKEVERVKRVWDNE